jgi:hypothetical protein
MKVVVVLLALMAGLPTMAFAHSGHQRGQSVAQPSSVYYAVSSAILTQAQHKKTSSHFTSTSNYELTGHVFESSSSGQSTGRCAPGTCCCQGASSCSSGHCCSFGLPNTHAYGMSQREDKSARLALLDWPYPDLIFGLDRPPKV